MEQKDIELLNRMMESFPMRRSSILPFLWRIQKDSKFITPEDLIFISQKLNLSPAHLRSVITFYTMFFYKHTQVTGPGRHLIQICTNISCMLMGAERLVDLVVQRYGLKEIFLDGKSILTSPDGRFSLITMECIGACDLAPAMIVDDNLHTSLNEDNIFEILSAYK